MSNKRGRKRRSSNNRSNKSVIWYLISPHPLTNLEIQKYYQIELKFNDVYSKSNLPKQKVEASIINFYEYKSIVTHWIALYVNGNNARYFESFGV